MKTIIVATDFSPNAMHATLYAAELANTMGARLVLFHHFTYPVAATDMPNIIPLYVDELAVDLENRLKKIKNDLQEEFPDLLVKVIVRSWIMIRDLEEAFRDEKADLVVMGLRGENPVLNTLFGSMTAKVIREGKMPTIVVPLKATFEVPKKILLAYNMDSQTDLYTIVPLRDLATIFDSYIKVATFYDEDETSAPVMIREETLIKKQLDHLLGSVRHGYALQEEPAVTDGILNVAGRFGADMIAMIPQHHSYLSNLLNRSVTQDLVTRIRVPLLVLHDKTHR